MLNNNYICGLDISSSKIAAACVLIEKKRIAGCFFDTMPSKGLKGGVIVDPIGLVGSIGRVLKNLKNKSGINIKFVYANISGQDILTKHSRAIIPLAERGNKVITGSDVRKVNEQARILGSSLEEELIHSVPFSYSVDSKDNIINPVGLYGHKLEADLYLISAKLSSIQSLTRAINQAGFEIKNLFLSSIATSSAVFDDTVKEGVNIFCDIGSDITEFLVFRDGLLKDLGILPVGGDSLTVALSETLNIPFDLAEDVKRSHASIGDFNQINEEREILIKQDAAYKPIKQKMVSGILTERVKSFSADLRGAVEKIIPCNKVNTFVATGRTVLLEGFLETLESTLGVCVKLGRIANPRIISLLNKDEALSGQKYLTYLSSLGLIAEGLRKEESRFLSIVHPARNPVLKVVNKVKEVYQEYF